MRFLALTLLFAFLVIDSGAMENFTFTTRQAIFGTDQFFWPNLSGSVTVDHPADAAHSAAVSVKVGVLPLQILDYRESIPCDSCHRLSANGMEFYLENFLKDRLTMRFPKAKVELLAPHAGILQSRKIDLLASLDSLRLPWDLWLDSTGQTLIYRPRERMLSPAEQKRLDKLGGLLDCDYLLLPARVFVHVTPDASNAHTGGLEWGLDLVFWDVRRGRLEWAQLYAEKTTGMDLDDALDKHLEQSLLKSWDTLPAAIKSLWKAEPR